MSLCSTVALVAKASGHGAQCGGAPQVWEGSRLMDSRFWGKKHNETCLSRILDEGMHYFELVNL